MRDRQRAVVGAAILLACLHCTRREPASRGPVPETAIEGGIASTAAPVGPGFPDASVGCDPGQLLLMVSPEHPTRGHPFRVLAVTDRRIEGFLPLDSAAGVPSSGSMDEGAGPPFLWTLPVDDAK